MLLIDLIDDERRVDLIENKFGIDIIINYLLF